MTPYICINENVFKLTFVQYFFSAAPGPFGCYLLLLLLLLASCIATSFLSRGPLEWRRHVFILVFSSRRP